MCLGKGGGRRGERRGIRDGPHLFTELSRSVWLSLRLLTLSRTGEATAEVEVQPLHAFGEDECTNITGEASAFAEDQARHPFGEDEGADVTGDATAAVESQCLHAFGKDECTDITCEGKTKRGLCDDGMRESAAAHG